MQQEVITHRKTPVGARVIARQRFKSNDDKTAIGHICDFSVTVKANVKHKLKGNDSKTAIGFKKLNSNDDNIAIGFKKVKQ